MDLETAVFRIAARQAAKLEREGVRIPLEHDALEKLKKDHSEFFVSGTVQTTGHQLAKPFPIRSNDRSGKRSDLIAEA